MGERLVECIDHHGEPFGRARVGGLGGLALLWPHGGDDGHLVLHRIEDHHHRRADQQGIGNADRVGIGLGELFDQADGVIAHIAEDPERHGRQRWRQVDRRLLKEIPQCLERAALARLERLRIARRRPVDLCLIAIGAPDQVGREADDRIAPAHRSALDGFQEEAHRLLIRELEHRRNGRFEIGDQARPDGLRLASAMNPGKLREVGIEPHRQGPP